MSDRFIAHRRGCDQKEQTVCDHLQSVSAICGRLAGKAGVSKAGSLIGLLHDLGKYGRYFQAYIRSANGMLNPDIDDAYVDFEKLKGKIDHSTAGAQWVWERCGHYGVQGKLIGQILAVCPASHHMAGSLLGRILPSIKRSS